MNGHLLDTNVLSEFNRRQAPDSNVSAWISQTDSNSLYVNVLSLAEIRFGIERMTPGKRRSELEHWLDVDLYAWFHDRILVVNDAIAQRWARMSAYREGIGRPLANVDGLLAATAAEYDLVLVTRNEGDFQNLSLQILNPWKFP